jgi:3-oxoacyl-[acyl-carrier-protein] synthase III
MEDRLVTAGEECGNTGSSSVALALAHCRRGERALIAGFGAGLSAAAGTVRLAGNFEGVVA